MDKHAMTFAVVWGSMALSAAPLMTPWGEKVTSENCWRDYPRPQMVRDNWTCLNGDWDWQVTSVTNTPGRPEAWAGKIRVPFAIESALSGVERKLEPDEFLWYTRTIDCAPAPGKRILLHFEAVDFRAMVFVGHREVTDVPHEGGQLPFTLDITDYVKPGANELTVCVWDPTDDFINSRGKQSLVPHGCFYTRSSGIVGSVWMETVPEQYIRSYKVYTDIDKGTVRFEFDKVEGAGEVKVTTDLPNNFTCWTPENPQLYSFTATYGEDVVKGYFGMRKFEKRKDANGVLRFFLNNKPVFLLGTLDQGWWPDGLLTPPSEEAMAFDIQTLKDCGYNMMRKHIKVEPRRYYYLCDKLGLLLIQDLTRRYDATRLVNGPSGCWDWEGGELLPFGWSKRVKTAHKPAGECEAADTVDYHLYRGPTMFPVNDRRISFLGEFGGLGHPVTGHLWREAKENWGYGGIEDTKTRGGLAQTYAKLMDEVGALAEKGLGGAVYTQTTDVEIEINGLLTYDRKVLKFDPAALKAVHARVFQRAAAATGRP